MPSAGRSAAAAAAPRMAALLTVLAALAAAQRRPGESSTVLQDYHSRQVAVCRRKGNLYAYYKPLDRCMPLLEDNSPCPVKEQVLVLNATTLEAQCMRLPCDVTHVLLPDGGCHTKEEFCDHAGDNELVLKETGYGTCDCPDLFVYWQSTDTCYEAYTRGPCAAGEYIVFREGAGVLCEASPCPEEQVLWRRRCVPRRGHGCLDSEHGHLVVNPANLKYECTLRCPDGMAEVELDCYDLYSRGPCPPGQYVVHVPGTQRGRCVENPCVGDGLVPWSGRCWQRGQYCSPDSPLLSGQLDVQSDRRQPQKRQPVRLPHDDHLVILGRDELRPVPAAGAVSEPQQAVGGTGGGGRGGRPAQPASTPRPGPSPPFRGRPFSFPQRPGQQAAPAPPRQPSRPFGPIFSHRQVLPPPPAFSQGNGKVFSHQAIVPPPPQFSQDNRVVSHQSVLPPPPDFNRADALVGPHQAVLPPPPQFNQAPEQETTHRRILPPPPQFIQPQNRVTSSQRSPVQPKTSQFSERPSPVETDRTRPQSPQVQQHAVKTPVTNVNLPSTGKPREQLVSGPAHSNTVKTVPPEITNRDHSADRSRPQKILPAQRPSQTGSRPRTEGGSQPSSRPAGGRRPQASPPPSVYLPPSGYLPPPPPVGYLPPPAESTLVRRHTAEQAAGDVLLPPDVSGPWTFSARLGFLAPPPPPPAASQDKPAAGRRRGRSARLDDSTAARLAELQENHGFITIDHPFSGNFETVSAVHGLHININPLTYQVECSDAIGFYRTISFAHYKCRPGSRRDLLGECHHEGPDWTDYHPDRCPFGKRHNLLTGKCIRIT